MGGREYSPPSPPLRSFWPCCQQVGGGGRAALLLRVVPCWGMRRASCDGAAACGEQCGVVEVCERAQFPFYALHHPCSTHCCCAAGMVSGWLLQTYCPDNGECVEGGGKPARRLLDAALARGRALLGAGGGGGAEPVAECNGRMLWLIVGLLTLTSPIVILITQVGRQPGWPRSACRQCVCALFRPGFLTSAAHVAHLPTMSPRHGSPLSMPPLPSLLMLQRWIRPTKDDFAKVGQLPTHHHRQGGRGYRCLQGAGGCAQLRLFVR